MGMAKKEMMRLQELEAHAMGVLVQAKAVEECPIHDGMFINQDDPDAVKHAYAIGTNLVKAGSVDGTREEFLGSIKSALESAGDECPICAKNRDED
jgi:hypothetical protein